MHARSARRASSGKRRQFRPDIEGLRAVAVLGVVLYHAHVGILRGGFTGVDVFFVISGYLITGLLWQELQGRGRISFAGFYGRRARRLLPAAISVIVATAIAARYLMPPLVLSSVAKDGLASALYVANYRFASTGTNYLNPAGSVVSPFQHYWSLGVEEQFYIVWPLLLLAGSLAWRYRGRYQHGSGTPNGQPSRPSAMAALAAVTVGSFFLSLWLTHANQPWAFFSLPTRAWELGLGGLLALAAPEINRLPREVARGLAWIGLALIVLSYFVISSSMPFPGTVALLPVVGAGAVLAGGQRAGAHGPVLILSRRAMRMIGRISYSWYLWHWPFLVLAPYAVGHSLNLAENLLVAALSGVVATLSFLLLENPARSWAWLSALPRRSLLTGATLSACGAVTCLVMSATLPSLAGHGLAPVAKITRPTTPVPNHTVSAPGVTTTTLDPLAEEAAQITAQVNAQVAATINVQDVPANLNPSVSDAGESNSPTFYDGCMDGYTDSTVALCEFGDTNSNVSVALFGDSHAAMWFPAVEGAALQHNWAVYNWTKATCPPLYNVPIISPVLGREFTECETWRQNVLSEIATVHPTVVILGVARHYTSIYGFTPYTAQWNNGLAQMVSAVEKLGSKVIVMSPIPKPPVDVADCLSDHLTTATACTMPIPTVIDVSGKAAEKAAVVAAGAFYINAEPWFCTSTTCGTMIGNILMWRDDNHISEPFSAFLAPAMGAEIAQVIPNGTNT
jgi:peptidoglycan/LPS O-acetylase OafA/YrhL